MSEEKNEPIAHELIAHYRTMLLIRRFEEKVDRLFATGELSGTSHLCAGQEATAVGGCAALQPDDLVSSNHRGHGHFLAKGGDPKRIMAELFGKETGYSRGKGGTQHMACLEIGFLGSFGITGGGIPIATGAALSAKLRKTGQVVLCFFGEGAANQGTFNESLNMAAIWRLPVVYLCENNLYAMSTPFGKAFAIGDIADRAAGYDMPGEVVDGNHLQTVKSAVAQAGSRARSGDGPTLIEAKTYRYFGHSRSDTRPYRTKQEEEDWKARDPINRARDFLSEQGWLKQTQDEEIRDQVKHEIEEAVEFARQSPVLPPEELCAGG